MTNASSHGASPQQTPAAETAADKVDTHDPLKVEKLANEGKKTDVAEVAKQQ